MRLRLVISTAAFAMLGSISLPRPAYAGNWPCEVALCLANPGGPTQYSACVPPITRLYQWLAVPWHSFPICNLVGGREAVRQYMFGNMFIINTPSGAMVMLRNIKRGPQTAPGFWLGPASRSPIPVP